MTATARETRTEFVARRTAEIAAEMHADPRFAGVALTDEITNAVAATQAENEWRRTRVYASPVKVMQSSRVWAGDGYTDGAEITFNPDAPAVSFTRLTYVEAAELRDALTALLESTGYDA